MSAIRMCDRCGNIFSEREEGWSTMQGTRMVRNEQGRMTQQVDQIDSCPKCSGGGEVVTPRLALERATGVDRIAQVQTQADRDRILDQLHTTDEPF